MNAPHVKTFFDEITNTCTHVVSDPATGRCAIVDPVLDFAANSGSTSTESADAVVAFVRSKNLQVDWIIETHVHADHLSGAPYLKQELGGKVAIGFNITTIQDTFGKIFNAGEGFAHDGRQFDVLFSEGEQFSIGELKAEAIYTPGHTPACMSYLVGDALFVGDTLFMPDYGSARCDFPGGDAAQLYQSVQKIFSLPAETRMFLCHDYLPEGREDYQWETTVGAQRDSNIHLHEGVSESAFVDMRAARDKSLSMPQLILPSVQVNMRAGEFPPAEGNGVQYLKLPVNLF